MYTFISGEDTFRSRRALKELIAKLQSSARPSEERGSTEASKPNVEIFYFDASVDDSADDFFLYTKSNSLFGGTSIGVVYYPLSGKPQNAEAFLRHAPELAIASGEYIFWEGALDSGVGKKSARGGSPSSVAELLRRTGASSRKKPAITGDILKKNAKRAFDFPLLKNSELKKYIQLLREEIGAVFSFGDVEMLAESFGGDLWAITNELEKAKLAGEFQFKKSRAVEEKAFAFTDALSLGEKGEAYRLYEGMRADGIDEFYLLGAVAGALRIMIKIKSILSTNPDYRAYEAFGLHPFVLKKTLSHIRRFRLSDLKRLYGVVLETDLRFKTSALEPETIFARLISEF
ncbi:MAG: hypothetical protein AAB362_02755 [Patescibacteria group bacterium]